MGKKTKSQTVFHLAATLITSLWRRARGRIRRGTNRGPTGNYEKRINLTLACSEEEGAAIGSTEKKKGPGGRLRRKCHRHYRGEGVGGDNESAQLPTSDSLRGPKRGRRHPEFHKSSLGAFRGHFIRYNVVLPVNSSGRLANGFVAIAAKELRMKDCNRIQQRY